MSSEISIFCHSNIQKYAVFIEKMFHRYTNRVSAGGRSCVTECIYPSFYAYIVVYISVTENRIIT